MIVPEALAVVIVALLALDRLTMKPSSNSTVLSPFTSTVMVFMLSPAAKATVPDGKLPTTKSLALAPFTPEPVTAQSAILLPVVSTVRLTTKV